MELTERGEKKQKSIEENMRKMKQKEKKKKDQNADGNNEIDEREEK